MQDARITESSGLAASGLHEDILWTHNDSGSPAVLYALGPDGRTRAALHLTGPAPRDWEALAPATDAQGRPALFVGDIGDNSSSRDRGILVHLVTEPADLVDVQVSPISYRLVYPDGPHDAEGLAVGPDGRLLVFTKGLLGGGVYAAPAVLDPAAPNVLERRGDLPPLVTDAALLPDGTLAVRDYAQVLLLDADYGVRERLALPASPQGESLALSADGSALLVGSEGVSSEIFRVPLPGLAPGQGSPAPVDDPVSAPSTNDEEPTSGEAVVDTGGQRAGGTALIALTVAVLAAIAVLAVILLGMRRRVRARRTGR